MSKAGRETIHAWLADPQHEAELLRMLKSKLWGMRYQMPGSITDEDSRDLLVEVVQAALNSTTGFDPPRGTMKGWLLGVATKVLLRWRDRAIRETNRRIETTDNGSSMNSQGSETPGDLHDRLIDGLRSRETVEGTVVGSVWLDKVMAMCSTANREVLNYIYVEGLTTEEIAQRLETTCGNVRIRHMRALKKLRECLSEDDQVPARRLAWSEYSVESGDAR